MQQNTEIWTVINKTKRSEDGVGFPMIKNFKNSHIFLSQQADACFSKFQKSENQQSLHSLKASWHSKVKLVLKITKQRCNKHISAEYKEYVLTAHLFNHSYLLLLCFFYLYEEFCKYRLCVSCICQI